MIAPELAPFVRFTNHVVPFGSPDSSKVTEYLLGEKEMDIEPGDPDDSTRVVI